METSREPVSAEVNLQRLWGRRLTGASLYEDDFVGELISRHVFPSAQVEIDENEVISKSRPSSPSPVRVPCDFRKDLVQESEAAHFQLECRCESEEELVELDGALIGDIPARYKVPALRKHEFPAVGVFIDPRILPGFKYRVRPIEKNGCKERWLFKGKVLELQSIGRGYSRRLTFKPDKGALNDNPHYFWSDSHPEGFAFELQVLSAGDKFTVFDASHVPVGTLEILSHQGPHEEIGQRVLNDGSIEKTARIKALCKVEWYDDNNTDPIVPMNGLAVCTRSKGGLVTKVIGATVGSHPRRGFTLTPGINNRLRSTRVKGESIQDAPTSYTVTGLEAYELPVIGTYVDPRITPGFHYKVRPAGSKRRAFFQGRPLCLKSIGMGYGKRLTFAPDSLNDSTNFFWSDSHPEGLGFEPSAVRTGMKFNIYTGELRLGEATVFRADAAQTEDSHRIVEDALGKRIEKRVHIDVKCHVSIDPSGTGSEKRLEPHVMRVSGTAIVSKRPAQSEAEVLRVENIGLDSHLNILFNTQWEQLVFLPAN